MTEAEAAYEKMFPVDAVVPRPAMADVQGWLAAGKLEAVRAIAEERARELALRRDDPFHHGWVPAHWREAARVVLGGWAEEILPPVRKRDAAAERKREPSARGAMTTALFGGNGSGKTWFAMWLAVRYAVLVPGTKVLVLHETEPASIDTHQAYLYHFLPSELKPTDERKVKRSVSTTISYNAKAGFTDNKLTLPGGSFVRFGFYSQDVKDYEGGGWSLIVADENMPLAWMQTLLYRLPRSNGHLLWCYTCVDGITPAMVEVLAKVRTIRHERAVHLPDGHRCAMDQDWPDGCMPRYQEGDKTAVLYWWSEDNPLSNPVEHVQIAKRRGRQEVERRVYGYARNVRGRTFAKFGEVNLIAPEDVPHGNVTAYHVLDPAGARNFFMLWAVVDEHGRLFIVKEWPDQDSIGEWAVTGSGQFWNGEAGPAQASLGYGVVEYKELILRSEGWARGDDGVWMPGKRVELREDGERFERPALHVLRRIIDPRSGTAAAAAERTGATSLLDRFAEENIGPDGKVETPGLYFEPGSGQHEEHGIMAINALLAWDVNLPRTALVNEPRLYVSRGCKNLIWAMEHYVPKTVRDEACKDPIDTLRYLVLANPIHVSADAMSGLAGRAGY